LHYTLDLSIDVGGNVISGTVTMEAQATRALDAFDLDFSELEIGGVEVNGKSADYSYDGDMLTIVPPAPLLDGHTFTVTVTYNGTPEPEQFRGNDYGWVHYGDGICVITLPPARPGSWYPVGDRADDKATYALRITVPKPFLVAANGMLKETIDNRDAMTYLWVMNAPMSGYDVTLNIAKYVVQADVGPDNLPIRNYFPPDLDETQTTVVGLVPEIIEFFSGAFGPFPFDSFGITVLEKGNGYSKATRVLVSRTVAEEITLAHEVAHQWFGNSVSPASLQDMWLIEGFARYAEVLWEEHVQGPDRRDARIESLYSSVGKSSLPPAKPSIDDLYSKSFNEAVYDRGALTLHALRLRVGDEVFFRTLRTYAGRYRYGSASTADFIAMAEEISEQDLDEFFAAWLYAEEVPDIPEMGLGWDEP
jgi:aminopeptidase N